MDPDPHEIDADLKPWSADDFSICVRQCCGSGSSRICTLLALLDPDPYIIYGSGSSNLKTDHKLEHLEYFMSFFKLV